MTCSPYLYRGPLMLLQLHNCLESEISMDISVANAYLINELWPEVTGIHRAFLYQNCAQQGLS